MKKNLQITGRVELDRAEISQAITKWLKQEHQLVAEKIVHEVNGSAVVYVHAAQQTDIVPEFKLKEKEIRASPKDHVIKNRGVMPFIREFLQDEKKQGKNDVKFELLLENVLSFFPAMDDRKLRIYLYDERQLPGIKWNAKANLITLHK